MSSITQKTMNENQISDFVARFVKEFHIGKLLFKCNAGKQKGVPVMDLFRYLLCLIFSDRSMYMQFKTDSFSEYFSKNTIYRFLNCKKINWQRFVTLLSAQIIGNFMKPLTNENRKDVFIVDDSLFDRSRSKKVELLANVFDHCSMKFKRGFRMLALGWSDGNSFIPVGHCLLSAADNKNLLCEAEKHDGRTLAGLRRRQARRKATDVMVDLIRSAQTAGIHAKYVLFDSWFSSPKTIIPLKRDCGLDTIAMVKKSKTKYQYRGQKLNVKQIYSSNRKRRGRSRYLLSVEILIEKEQENLPARLVFVRNKSNRKDWLVLISTDMQITEEEIIRIYGKRWQIEVFFKTCKSSLHLVKECRSTSFDTLNAHIAIVFTRYMMLSVAQRREEDDRTLGEIFFFLQDELADITFSETLQIIMDALLEAVMEYFHITEEQLDEFTANFIVHLPTYMKETLNSGANAV